MFWIIFICFICCSIAFLLGLMLGSALTRNQIYEDMEEYGTREKLKRSAGGYKFFILAFLLLPLLGCIPSPPPQEVVIERSCKFAELDPKPDLPGVSWVQGGNCAFYRCLTQENYEALRTRDAMLRADSRYVRQVYAGAMERCQ